MAITHPATYGYSYTSYGRRVSFSITKNPESDCNFFRVYLKDAATGNVVNKTVTTSSLGTIVFNIAENTQYIYSIHQGKDGHDYKGEDRGYIIQGATGISTTYDKFSWSTSFSKGQVMNTYQGQPAPLTYQEWNRFQDFSVTIAEVKGVTINIERVSRAGIPMSASLINNAIAALRAIPGLNTSLLPASVTKGTPVGASTFIGLRNAINSVP